MDFNEKGLIIVKNPRTKEEIPFVDAVGIIRENTTKHLNQKKGLEKKKSADELHQFIDSTFGNFHFSCYSNLLQLKIDKQYKFRFMYLCTYINYENKLEYGNSKGQSKLMLEKDLQEVLGLSERETRNTKNALKKNKLLIVNKDGTLSVNDSYCIKGKINKRKVKESIRVMENGIRELYKKATPKEHKRLELFVEVLPYVNYHHNILCVNPEEEDIEEVIPLTLKDLCLLVGYNETNSSRLKRELLSIKVNGEDSICIVLKNVKHYIYVNPRLYYKGNNIKKLEALCNIFKVI